MENTRLVTRMDVRVPTRERRINEHTGKTTWVTTGHVTARVDVEVNLNECATLAEKAALNRSHQARSGPCVARVYFEKGK